MSAQRELKFRAWDVAKATMFQWNEIHHHPGWWLFNDAYPGWKVMQYTGLKDKNGKEIYEGDILATSNDGKDGCDEWEEIVIGMVEWNPERAYFTNVPDTEEDSMYSAQYVYIKGNIYEDAARVRAREGSEPLGSSERSEESRATARGEEPDGEERTGTPKEPHQH